MKPANCAVPAEWSEREDRRAPDGRLRQLDSVSVGSGALFVGLAASSRAPPMARAYAARQGNCTP